MSGFVCMIILWLIKFVLHTFISTCFCNLFAILGVLITTSCILSFLNWIKGETLYCQSLVKTLLPLTCVLWESNLERRGREWSSFVIWQKLINSINNDIVLWLVPHAESVHYWKTKASIYRGVHFCVLGHLLFMLLRVPVYQLMSATFNGTSYKLAVQVLWCK